MASNQGGNAGWCLQGFQNSLVNCENIDHLQNWNVLNTPGIIWMVLSKLPRKMVSKGIDNTKKGQQRTRNGWLYPAFQRRNPNCDWPSVLKRSSRTISRKESKPQKEEDFNIYNWKWGESKYIHLLWWKALARRL